jgi:hypothetical protein
MRCLLVVGESAIFACVNTDGGDVVTEIRNWIGILRFSFMHEFSHDAPPRVSVSSGMSSVRSGGAA